MTWESNTPLGRPLSYSAGNYIIITTVMGWKIYDRRNKMLKYGPYLTAKEAMRAIEAAEELEGWEPHVVD